MNSLRRITSRSPKLCGSFGNWCIGSSSINSRRRAAGKDRGTFRHSDYDGSRLLGLPLPAGNSRTALPHARAAPVSGSPALAASQSIESSGLRQFPQHPFPGGRWGQCACNTLQPLFRKCNLKCTFNDITSEPLTIGLHGIPSVLTCWKPFPASGKLSAGFASRSGCGLQQDNGCQPPTRQEFARLSTWFRNGGASTHAAIVHSCRTPPADLPATAYSSDFVRSSVCRPTGHQEDSQHRKTGRLPLFAMSIATSLVLPLQKDREASTSPGGDGATDFSPGCHLCPNATDSLLACHPEGAKNAIQARFQWWTALYAAALLGGAAEPLQQRLVFTKERVTGRTEGAGFGGGEYFSSNAWCLWWALQQRCASLASALTQQLGSIVLSSKKSYSIRNRGAQQAVPETAQAKVELEEPKCAEMLTCDEATIGKLESEGASTTGAERRDHTRHPGPQAACQTEKDHRPGAAPASAANAQRIREQPEHLVTDSAKHYPDVASQPVSWFAAVARAIGVFLQTFASVGQRLVFVLPLALVAGAAAFWLVTLPYISMCLKLVGIGGQRVLRWEAIAQHELEEVIFTAITAAASAAGPTYVKFLQWIATRPDLFHESLCSRCAKLQTAVRPFSYPRAAMLLRSQFGDEVAQHLVLDPMPIGCGCIAQVYRAYLLLSEGNSADSRRRFLQHCFVLGGSISNPPDVEAGGGGKIPPVAVAVKVMRPGVREAMEFDLRMMLLIASAIQCLPAFGFVAVKNRLSLERWSIKENMPPAGNYFLSKMARVVRLVVSFFWRSVEEFAVAMRRQLDFSIEESHLKHFRTNFGLPSPPVPADLLPLHNRCRREVEIGPSGSSVGDASAQPQYRNVLSSLPLKLLGMRRQVTFPYPFEALSSSEVLIMTLEGGFTLNQLFKIKSKLEEMEQQALGKGTLRGHAAHAAESNKPRPDDGQPSPKSAAIKIIEMVFLDNFFHGDMHSGNLLCRFARETKELIFPVVPATAALRGSLDSPHPDGVFCNSVTLDPYSMRLVLPRQRLKSTSSDASVEGRLELVVLDCGLAGSLSQADRVNFVTLLEAIARKRGREAAKAMLQRARRSACKDEAGFCSEVEKLINENHFQEGNSLRMSRVRFTSLMGRMLSLSKEYSVELDPSFVSIVVAMSVLEGVGAQLCPDADVLKAAMPYSFLAAKILGSAMGRVG